MRHYFWASERTFLVFWLGRRRLHIVIIRRRWTSPVRWWWEVETKVKKLSFASFSFSTRASKLDLHGNKRFVVDEIFSRRFPACWGRFEWESSLKRWKIIKKERKMIFYIIFLHSIKHGKRSSWALWTRLALTVWRRRALIDFWRCLTWRKKSSVEFSVEISPLPSVRSFYIFCVDC